MWQVQKKVIYTLSKARLTQYGSAQNSDTQYTSVDISCTEFGPKKAQK